MSKNTYSYFDDNYDKLINEIVIEKNIELFHKKHCCKDRDESIFCCKLFHVCLPDEFPPIDNNIIKHFNLSSNYKMISYRILKCGYEIFIKKNKEKIKMIRQILSEKKYDYIRINEINDYRILDMVYWFLLNRRKNNNGKIM